MKQDQSVEDQLALLRSEYFLVQWLVCDGSGSVPYEAQLFMEKSHAAAKRLIKFFKQRSLQKQFDRNKAAS